MPLKPPTGFRNRYFFIFFSLLVSVSLLALLSTPNPLTDSLVSRVCSSAVGNPIELHGVRFGFPSKGSIDLRIREINLRPMWRGADSAAGRFFREHKLDDLLELKDTVWVLKTRLGSWYLRLLNAGAGELSMRGGLRLDKGRIKRWNAAFRLPKKISERFPQIIEKRFAQDGYGRRILKMTWANGRWRLWGRSGPVLEAKWQ